jgi:hypothetical protein
VATGPEAFTTSIEWSVRAQRTRRFCGGEQLCSPGAGGGGFRAVEEGPWPQRYMLPHASSYVNRVVWTRLSPRARVPFSAELLARHAQFRGRIAWRITCAHSGE